MNTKTIEQVNVLKADALAIVEGGKNDLGCISGMAGMTEIGFFNADLVSVTFAISIGGLAAESFCK